MLLPLAAVLSGLFALVARDLLRLTETPERAGALLAGLATDPLPQTADVQYWSNRVLGPGRLRFQACQPSAEARDEALSEQVWDLSAAAVGLSPLCGLETTPG